MSSTRIREFEKLTYFSPKEILIKLRDIQETYPLEDMPYDVASLRTHQLRHFAESRQCALFCYGISQIFGLEISYAEHEDLDHDFVARYPSEDVLNYVPIQMKEFVPERVNAKADLEQELGKLKKYADSSELVVAVHLNRDARIDFRARRIADLGVKELWFFGARSPDQLKWLLVGNMLNEWRVYEFDYPSAGA